MLIFFSSYGLMEKCLELWNKGRSNVYSELNKIKKIYEEVFI